MQRSTVYRIACDMCTLFYVFDEFTDIVDGKGAQEPSNLTLKPLKDFNSECGEDQHALGKVAFGCVIIRYEEITILTSAVVDSGSASWR
ncbi:hypothetical protein B0H12DRAFT_470078 [Mycena haematopus]|nr:hypothetical protein B0H12DRAFT_470078 [Mycena haematopus]